MNPILETILMFGGAIFLVFLGMIAVPFAQKKGWLKPSNIKLTEQMLTVLKVILIKNLSDSEAQNRVEMIYESFKSALKFVQDVYGLTLEQKKVMIFNRTIHELNKYGIIADDDDKEIINIIIDNAVELLNKD